MNALVIIAALFFCSANLVGSFWHALVDCRHDQIRHPWNAVLGWLFAVMLATACLIPSFPQP